MISFPAFFWIIVVSFGVIGMMRGWTKEVIVTAGLVLSLFAQLWFGDILINLFRSDGSTSDELMRSQFMIRSVAHALFAFFAYQGPALARQVSGGRFGEQARSNIQQSLLGFVFGIVNGYLLAGAIWSFLEFDIVNKVVTQYPMEWGYPFPAEMISRPVIGSAAYEMVSMLPLPLLQGWLPLLVIVLFFFVIVAMI